jgi:hypothetical protein
MPETAGLSSVLSVSGRMMPAAITEMLVFINGSADRAEKMNNSSTV